MVSANPYKVSSHMRCSFFKEKTFLGDEKQPLLSKIFLPKTG